METGMIYTPDNEPYRGRQMVFQFDQTIQVAMEKNFLIAPWTHDRDLTLLQLAATEIVPHGFSIALSIRELIRQGYLLSAEILLRPLIERVAVLSYLCETPSALALWEAGWPHKSRPSLSKMLAAMGPSEVGFDSKEMAQDATRYYNALIHADPSGSKRHMGNTTAGRRGYSASKSLSDTTKCDEICREAFVYLYILTARASQVFAEALK
jgi:hypothetical protein